MKTMSREYSTFAELEETPPVDVTDRLAVEYLLGKLTPLQQDILLLYHVEELTFSEIGAIVGHRYRRRKLSVSTIRYHHEKIKTILKGFRSDLGL